MSFLSRFFGKNQSERRPSLANTKKLRMESLENRELLSVSPLGTDTDSANLYNNQAYFGEDAYSQEAITADAAVADLAATAITNESVDLSWTDFTDNEGYQIQYSTDPAFPVGDDTLTDAPALDATSATISDLEAATTYYFQIRAKTGADTYSDWSSTLTVMTDDVYYGNNSVASATTLNAIEGEKSVEDLVILAGTEDYFSFTTNGACTKDHFVKINFNVADGPLALDLLDSTGAAVVPARTAVAGDGYLIIDLDGLAADTYMVKISGNDATVSNTYSLDFNVYTWLDTFAVTALTKDSIALAWTDPVAANGLELEYSADQDSWTPVTGVNLTEEAATISSLTAATTYYVRIRAETGTDEYSAWSTVTVKTDDRYESNDSKTAVDALTAGATDSANLGALNGKTVIDNLVLVAGNDDYFRFEITEAGTENHFVRIDFAHDQGDLVLTVYESDGTTPVGQSDTSNTTDGFELVSLDGLAVGVYYVKVTGASSSVSNPDYTLTLRTSFDAPVLTATATAGQPVSLTWTASGAVSYSVWRQSDGGSWTRIASNLTTLAYTDRAATNGTYSYMVYAHVETEFKASEAKPVTVTGSLDAPVLTVTSTEGNKATLSWTAPDGATSYSVWRQNTDDGSWTRIASGLTETTFVDRSAPAGEQTYMVYAYRNTEYKTSETVSVTVLAPLTAPILTATSVTGAPASLSWTESVGATSYSVWRQNTDLSWTRIASNVKMLSYVDGSVSVDTYKYKVYAVRGTESVVSDEATVNVAEALIAPVLTVTSSEGRPASLTWSQPAGAETYSVWRMNADESWTRIANKLTAAEYVDYSASNGSQTYMVLAHRENEYKASTAKVVTVAGALEAPTLEATAETDGTVSLTWTGATGATSYSVWRMDADGSWTRVAKELTTAEYVDRSASNGSQTYMVFAHRENEYKASATKVVTVAGALEAPVVTAESTVVGTVDLTWTAPTGAENYSVWRQNATGSWTRIANKLTATSFTDSSAPEGSQTYMVYAYRGTEYKASETVSVTVLSDVIDSLAEIL